jgi:hypothetical protein
MKATNKLRFVERYVPAPEHGEDILKKVRILQQWWETSSMGTMSMGFGDPMPLGEVTGEWRDVPVEVEA